MLILACGGSFASPGPAGDPFLGRHNLTSDLNALEALGEGTRLELSWQVSWDLLDWQPGPPSAVVRHEGRLAVERITLGAYEPPIARLMVRRAR